MSLYMESRTGIVVVLQAPIVGWSLLPLRLTWIGRNVPDSIV